MGIVAKQSKLNAIYVFTGFAIGGITNIIFPRWFGNNLELLGIIQFVTTYGILFAQFLNMGSHMIIIRNYPAYISINNTNKAFFYGLFFPLIGLFLFGIFMFFANEFFFELSSKEKINYPLNELAMVIFLITCAMTYTRSIGSIAVAKMRTAYITFLNEVFIRVILFICVILYFNTQLSFGTLLWMHVIAYFIQFLLVLPASGFEIIKKESIPGKQEIKLNLLYGLFAMFESGASIVINRIDVIMLAALLSIEIIPVYGFAFALATVLLLPARALNIATVSIVSDHYHHSRWSEIEDLYKRSASIQFVIGALIFLMIWISIDELFMFVPEIYSAGKYAFLFLGVSKLFDLFTSINGIIIQVSKWYWYNFIFNLILLLLAIITNIWLIPAYGVTGAALATAISIFLFNLAKTYFVYKKFKILPISSKMLYTLILLLALTPVEWIDLEVYFIWSILIKSGMTAIVFTLLCYFFKVSEDLNKMINQMILFRK
jgi:O-antigen/teichoic acid export membrane protein